MRRLLALLAATAGFGVALPVVAHAAPDRFDTGTQDPLEFSEADPQGAYDAIRAEGMHFVRLPVAWSNVAPHRPAHPTDPGDAAYDWSGTDGRLSSIVDRGMVPVLVIYAPPGWARPGGRRTASAIDYAGFVDAVAKRYGGGGGHPRVRYYQLWNEPNLKMFLDDTAAHYRDMLNAGYKAVHAVHRDNVVISGGLGPFSDPENSFGLPPFPYMRSLLCMSKGRNPHPTCKAKISFDIWAHHPYTSGGPNHSATLAQDASMGDLPEMRRLLDAARRAGHIKSRGTPGFWVTEFGWDTKGPDPGGVPLERHARWVAEAMYRMWESGVSTMFWFKLRDDIPPDESSWGGSFQGGIYFNTTPLYADERVKPVGQVLRFPFVAVPERGRVSVWGRTPRSSSGRVTIQLRQGSKWRAIAKISANRHGLFRLRLAGRRGALLRARADGQASHPFKAVPTPDVIVKAFGGAP